MTKRSTFDSIKTWLEEAKNYGHTNMTFLLIGNKSDLSSSRQVSSQEGESFARQYGFEFLETSAKDNVNVQTVFIQSALSILRRVKGQHIKVDQSGTEGVKKNPYYTDINKQLNSNKNSDNSEKYMQLNEQQESTCNSCC